LINIIHFDKFLSVICPNSASSYYFV